MVAALSCSRGADNRSRRHRSNRGRLGFPLAPVCPRPHRRATALRVLQTRPRPARLALGRCRGCPLSRRTLQSDGSSRGAPALVGTPARHRRATDFGQAFAHRGCRARSQAPKPMDRPCPTRASRRLRSLPRAATARGPALAGCRLCRWARARARSATPEAPESVHANRTRPGAQPRARETSRDSRAAFQWMERDILPGACTTTRRKVRRTRADASAHRRHPPSRARRPACARGSGAPRQRGDWGCRRVLRQWRRHARPQSSPCMGAWIPCAMARPRA